MFFITTIFLFQMYTASPNYSQTTYYTEVNNSVNNTSNNSGNNSMTTTTAGGGNSNSNGAAAPNNTSVTDAANTIESGPSFNESLQRFKTASGHNAQMASWKHSVKSSSSSSSSVQKRVEETRTMITQSSQKSYHIE